VPADLKVCIHACSLCRVVIVNARVELQIFILKQETMGQLLTAKTTMPEMIECLSQAEEFLDFKPRNDQKKILEDANKVRYATDGLHPCPVKVVDLIRNVEHSCTYQKRAEGCAFVVFTVTGLVITTLLPLGMLQRGGERLCKPFCHRPQAPRLCSSLVNVRSRGCGPAVLRLH
jgi:hypothetical protein